MNESNLPKWTLFQLIHVWLEWRHWVNEDRQLGREPIGFPKFVAYWEAHYAESSIKGK